MCALACVRACERACVRACVHACACVCVCVLACVRACVRACARPLCLLAAAADCVGLYRRERNVLESGKEVRRGRRRTVVDGRSRVSIVVK